MIKPHLYHAIGTIMAGNLGTCVGLDLADFVDTQQKASRIDVGITEWSRKKFTKLNALSFCNCLQ